MKKLKSKPQSSSSRVLEKSGAVNSVKTAVDPGAESVSFGLLYEGLAEASLHYKLQREETTPLGRAQPDAAAWRAKGPGVLDP